MIVVASTQQVTDSYSIQLRVTQSHHEVGLITHSTCMYMQALRLLASSHYYQLHFWTTDPTKPHDSGKCRGGSKGWPGGHAPRV